MEYIASLWSDPAGLRRLGVVLQWMAIGLVFLGGIVQIGKLFIDVREKSLSALMAAEKEQQAQHRALELEGRLNTSQEELGRVRASAGDLEKRLKEAEAVGPKMDRSGRILASPFVSFASEFTDGIARARALFAEGKLDEAYAVAEELTKKRSDFGLAYFIMGTVEVQKQHHEAAERLLKTALDKGLLKDDEVWARNNLAVVYVATGRGAQQS